MTHTPGPWFYSRNGNPIYITGNWDKVAGTYADVAEIAQQEQSEAQANARLIAAAPDMLAALKAILDETGGMGGPFTAARAAIAKATGEGKP